MDRSGALQAHAPCHALGVDRSGFGMASVVLGLARVVQQHGEVENVRPRDILQELTLYFEKGGSVRVDNLVEHLDADERVLVGGIAVKKLVLHETGERAKLREETAEISRVRASCAAPARLVPLRERMASSVSRTAVLINETAVD